MKIEKREMVVFVCEVCKKDFANAHAHDRHQREHKRATCQHTTRNYYLSTYELDGCYESSVVMECKDCDLIVTKSIPQRGHGALDQLFKNLGGEELVK